MYKVFKTYRAKERIMRNTKVWAWVISVITFVLGVMATLLLLDSTDSTKVVPWAENIILITSFVISFVAFVFSMVTYFSIDAVNSVTAMDGNVLENEDYAIAYEEMIDNFMDEADQKAFSKKLLKIVRCPRKTKSCIIFADYLQNILDHIILFAYVDLNDNEIRKECDKLIKIIGDEANYYKKLSNGIKYQLDENVKLIAYIMDYQKARSKKQDWEFSKMENIRGNMLKNPISKILYYDYLGLDYRRKAGKILSACEYVKGEFESESMRAIMKYGYSEEDMKHINCLIERADMCFVKAQALARENILWEGYISYNKVRIEIMKYLIGKGQTKEYILAELDRIISVRENVEYLFSRTNSFLNTQFKKEVDTVKELKENFEKVF